MSVVCCLCLGRCLCMWHVAYVCGCCLCLWLLPVSAACHLHLVVTYVCSVLLMCAVIAYVCSMSPMSGCRLRLWWVAYVCAWCLCLVVAAYVCGVSPMSVVCCLCVWLLPMCGCVYIHRSPCVLGGEEHVGQFVVCGSIRSHLQPLLQQQVHLQRRLALQAQQRVT